jgi:hypothetical protein
MPAPATCTTRGCGNPARLGYKLCWACAKRSRDQANKRTRQLREAGMCIRCGKAPAAEGRKMCGPCLEVNNIQSSSYHGGPQALRAGGGGVSRRMLHCDAAGRGLLRLVCGACGRAGAGASSAPSAGVRAKGRTARDDGWYLRPHEPGGARSPGAARSAHARPDRRMCPTHAGQMRW